VDGNNNGESTLVSFGGYVGCNIVIEHDGDAVKYDAYCRPITFDGNLLKHWNTPDLVGDKYSLVFFRL
jgi:antibiotic biosynthesis monooxygenase (ABM) superfamily enzyme